MFNIVRKPHPLRVDSTMAVSTDIRHLRLLTVGWPILQRFILRQGIGVSHFRGATVGPVVQLGRRIRMWYVLTQNSH